MGKKKGRIISRLLILFILLFAAAAAIVYIAKGKINEYQAKVIELNDQIATNTKTVYVATDNIIAGDELILNQNIMEQNISSGIDGSLYLNDMDLQADVSIALVSVPAGQPIMKNMTTTRSTGAGVREVEVNTATLLVDSKTNDVVDIRIAFPDGSDYCVLSKKQMHQLVYNSSIWYTDMNEQEILTYTSAITDAYTNTGTYLYLTRYTTPTVQEATQCNYPINGIAHDMINGTGETVNKNIDREVATYEQMTETLNIAARSRLEIKLGTLSSEQLAAVASGRGLQDTASGTAYAGMQQNIEDGGTGYVEEGDVNTDAESDSIDASNAKTDSTDTDDQSLEANDNKNKGTKQ